jgi:adenylate cyclase
VAAILTVFLGFTTLRPGVFEALSHGRLRRSSVAAVMLAALAFELTVRGVIGWHLRTNRNPPFLLRYAGAFVETSIPTAIILLAAQAIGPVYALLITPVFLYFVFIILSTLRLDAGLCLFTGVVAAGEYLVLALAFTAGPHDAAIEPILAAPPHHIGKALLLLATGAVAALVARRIRAQFERTLEHVEERDRIVDEFGRYVSPAVVDRLLAQKSELGSETRHVCIMFLDIRNFTAFSEKRSPEEVFRYLNRLFEFMIESVNRHNGMINKFLGDGFMAVLALLLRARTSLRSYGL